MVLHIIRKHNDDYATNIIALHKEFSEGEEIAVLLLQDAVTLNVKGDIAVYVCAGDINKAGGNTPYQQVDYDHIAELIECASKVVCW